MITDPLISPAGPDFTHVETWVFDLDNTLYPSHCNLFAQIEARMGAFIAQRLDLPPDRAHAVRRQFYMEHGTTLAGLMKVHNIAPHDFLDFVHDIDLTPVTPNLELDTILSALPGRKVVFTNGSARHAQNVMHKVGITHHFEAIFDIEAANYVPKPAAATYDALIAATGCAPTRAAMFDDISRNLVAARALGMTTVWIRTPDDWSAGGLQTHDHVHHIADDLTDFLKQIVARNTEGKA